MYLYFLFYPVLSRYNFFFKKKKSTDYLFIYFAPGTYTVINY